MASPPTRKSAAPTIASPFAATPAATTPSVTSPVAGTPVAASPAAAMPAGATPVLMISAIAPPAPAAQPLSTPGTQTPSKKLPTTTRKCADASVSTPGGVNGRHGAAPCGMHQCKTPMIRVWSQLKMILHDISKRSGQASEFAKDLATRFRKAQIQEKSEPARMNFLPQVPLDDAEIDKYYTESDMATMFRNAYSNLQHYAVVLDLASDDQMDAHMFRGDFQQVEHSLQSVLCEMYCAMNALKFKRDPEVDRDMIPAEYRRPANEMKKSDVAIRDYVFVRDFAAMAKSVSSLFSRLAQDPSKRPEKVRPDESPEKNPGSGAASVPASLGQ